MVSRAAKSWAGEYISALQRGETVQFRPRGRSMHPRVRDGQLCTVKPLTKDERRALAVGSVVLCRVNRADYLHLVKERRRPNEFGHVLYLIGNNRGGTNGWLEDRDVFGILQEEPAKEPR